MKLSLEKIKNTQVLDLKLFDGYNICYRKTIGGKIGWCLLGHLQEIWMPAECLTLSQIKGLIRLEKRSNIMLGKKHETVTR